mgnify:CR=1 FL=1
MTIFADDYVGNLLSLQKFGWAGRLEVLNGPVDKTRWQMTPATVVRESELLLANASLDPCLLLADFVILMLFAQSLTRLLV